MILRALIYSRNVPFTIETGQSHRTHSARHIAVPLVAGRLNYRSASEPCVFIVHLDLCYVHLC